MGEHHDVAQYMMEMGGLSITGIQELAAGKIQVIFYVRKGFFIHLGSLMLVAQIQCTVMIR